MRNHLPVLHRLVGIGALAFGLGACAPNPRFQAPTSPVEGDPAVGEQMKLPTTVNAEDTGAFGWQNGRFELGGSVSGLQGSGLVVRANGGEPLAIAANGTFRFPEGTKAFSLYDVGIAAQPVRPWQRCEISRPRGLADGPIEDLSIACTTRKYIVGGSVSGLHGKLTIENAGQEQVTLDYDTRFLFTQQVPSGAAYDVRIVEQPAGQHCVVENASDTVDWEDRRDVAIRCASVGCMNRGWKTGSQDWTCPPGYRLPHADERDAVSPCLTGADSARLSMVADVGIAAGGCGCDWNDKYCGKPSIQTMSGGRACGDYAQLHICVAQ
jgi:hypothetical protein